MNKGISIIIPIINERALLPALLQQLQQFSPYPHQLLFVDGGSSDGSDTYLKQQNCECISTSKGRAIQMNCGAKHAKYPWLYFLHADSGLPPNAAKLLWGATDDPQQAACFRLKFNSSHWLLRLSARATRANHLLCRGGDQSLLLHRDFFQQLGGYNSRFKICEDIDLIRRVYKNGRFKILNAALTTSARRFKENGVFKLLFHFGIIHQMHFFGRSPERLYRYYNKFVK